MSALSYVEELGHATTCVGYGRLDLLAAYDLPALDSAWTGYVTALVDRDRTISPVDLVAATNHRPHPLRFIWHHIQPQTCGGLTIAANLAPLCDSCHYATHALMWALAHGLDVTTEPALVPHATNQLRLAQLGIYRLEQAGVPLSCVPKESSL